MFTDKKLGISNQDKLRIEHQKLLYKLFRDGQTYSCADIARATGLSNTAAANIVDALLKYRIVRQSDASGMISMGRPPVLYELNPDYGRRSNRHRIRHENAHFAPKRHTRVRLYYG